MRNFYQKLLTFLLTFFNLHRPMFHLTCEWDGSLTCIYPSFHETKRRKHGRNFIFLLPKSICVILTMLWSKVLTITKNALKTCKCHFNFIVFCRNMKIYIGFCSVYSGFAVWSSMLNSYSSLHKRFSYRQFESDKEHWFYIFSIYLPLGN